VAFLFPFSKAIKISAPFSLGRLLRAFLEKERLSRRKNSYSRTAPIHATLPEGVKNPDRFSLGENERI
jgi:hypothetical protein